MFNRAISLDTQKALRSALLLWIVYFFAVGLVDWLYILNEPGLMVYYLIQGFNGLLILGVTALPWRRFGAARVMLPIALVLMATLPTLTVHIMVRLVAIFSPEGPGRPLLSPDAMTLRLMPVLLMGLLLTVWKYQWRHVVLFCLGIAALNLAPFVGLLGLRQRPLTFPFREILLTAIQLISLLLVGYFTSTIVSRLRKQQRALVEANAQLRDYASTQIELTISHERNRMARELHDTLAHTLSGLTVQLQTVKAYWEIEPTTSQKLLNDALAATRDGLQETRGALKSLRATPLEDLGLPLAIRQLAEEAAARANLELDLLIAEPLPSFAPETSHAIYRVAQEAIMNIIYHANAKTFSVHITADEGDILLKVVDNGCGFESNRPYHNHWGVKGMRERAQFVDGQLQIESRSGYGTTIQLTVPGRSF